MIITLESGAEDMVPVELGNEARRARECAAFAFLATALVKVCVRTIHVIAMYKLSFAPQHEGVRALIHCAETFLITAR